MDELKCPVCSSPAVLLTQTNLPRGWGDMRRFWAQCTKCAYISRTFENAQQVRVHLGQTE